MRTDRDNGVTLQARVSDPMASVRRAHMHVLGRTRGHATDHVTVTAPEGATDAELADVAGYCSSHFGYTVTRHGDHTATVALWND